MLTSQHARSEVVRLGGIQLMISEKEPMWSGLTTTVCRTVSPQPYVVRFHDLSLELILSIISTISGGGRYLYMRNNMTRINKNRHMMNTITDPTMIDVLFFS